eukprot:5673095-Amphidinium_carterae.1
MKLCRAANVAVLSQTVDGNSSGDEGWGPYIQQRNAPSTPAGEPPSVGRIPQTKTPTGFRRLLAELASVFEEQAAELSLATADASELREQLREAKQRSPGKILAGGRQMTRTLDIDTIHTEGSDPNRRVAAARQLSRATSRIAAP